MGNGGSGTGPRTRETRGASPEAAPRPSAAVQGPRCPRPPFAHPRAPRNVKPSVSHPRGSEGEGEAAGRVWPRGKRTGRPLRTPRLGSFPGGPGQLIPASSAHRRGRYLAHCPWNLPL